ncbi:DUF1624 domain-containing protein [Aquibium sp. A9E412]|uniref:DUF1624 domain-containing protein n=1 Tax=Aquibium sp. A9E412 TaxID=2976767 RepID=UPI0025B21F9E|nr:DUF1624 domain-containing protein [Aquibium sp. A9E412]MDN2567518.1 DUF1624 domain-containing protein [Aquibium sp. A9E412]
MQRALVDKPSRFEAIDLARGLALVAMAVYHLGWDFEFFGYMDPGTTVTGGWRLFARSIASSFLFLVGVSLVLAHGRGIRWRAFARRLAVVAAAAGAITLATWLVMPGGFIFFGILHHIAVASLVGLAFLRLPVALVLAAAVVVAVLPNVWRAAIFDQPWLWWVGLSVHPPTANDYVPLFPWFAAVLAGIAATRLALRARLMERLGAWRFSAWAVPFRFFGRHSLTFYLLHQPVLIAGVWLFAQVWPAAERPPETAFMLSCQAQCERTREAAFCTAYCACVLDVVDAEGRLETLLSGGGGAASSRRIREIANQCTAEVEFGGNRDGGRDE